MNMYSVGMNILWLIYNIDAIIFWSALLFFAYKYFVWFAGDPIESSKKTFVFVTIFIIAVVIYHFYLIVLPMSIVYSKAGVLILAVTFLYFGVNLKTLRNYIYMIASGLFDRFVIMNKKEGTGGNTWDI